MSLCKRKIFRPLIKCIHHYYIQNKVNKPYNFCQLQEYVLDIKNSLRGSDSLKEDFATVRWHNNKLFWSGRTNQLRNLLFGKFRQCKIFLQNLMCMSFCISCRNAIFTTKFQGFNCLHVFYNFCQIWYLLFFLFYLSRMGHSIVPRVKYNNLLGTQKSVSLDFEEEEACEGRLGNFKIPYPIITSPPLHGWNIVHTL